MMTDMVLPLVVAVGCALVVAVGGAFVLRAWRERSVTVVVSALLVTTVSSLLAGISGAAAAVFLSARDVRVLLFLVVTLGVVGLAIALWGVWRLTSEATW